MDDNKTAFEQYVLIQEDDKDVAHAAGALIKSDFLKRIFGGYTINEACAFCKITPLALAVLRRNDHEFDALLREGQAYHVDQMVDRLLTIDEEFKDPKLASVISKNIQWVAERRLRKIYGNKTDISVTHTINIKQAMQEAATRTLGYIDHKPLGNNTLSSDGVSQVRPLSYETDDDIDPLS